MGLIRGHNNECRFYIQCKNGGGNELAAWGPSNPKWTFTGVDPSEEMLKIAKHKVVELGLEGRANLIQGTTEDLPQSDSKFDAASCILVLHFIDDIQEKLRLLGSIKDKLKPGAAAVRSSLYFLKNKSKSCWHNLALRE